MTQIAQAISRTILACSPVEEILKHGSITSCMDYLFWRIFQGKNFKFFKPLDKVFSLMDVLLVGQSFGFAIARSLAFRLCTSGFRVRGLVALDCRCIERTVLSTVYVVPRSLRQGLVPINFRCMDQEVHIVTPLVPRVTLTARNFCNRAILSPEVSLASATAVASWVFDGDHWNVPVSHAWDITRA